MLAVTSPAMRRHSLRELIWKYVYIRRSYLNFNNIVMYSGLLICLRSMADVVYKPTTTISGFAGNVMICACCVFHAGKYPVHSYTIVLLVQILHLPWDSCCIRIMGQILIFSHDLQFPAGNEDYMI